MWGPPSRGKLLAFHSHCVVTGSKSKPFSWAPIRTSHYKSILIMIFIQRNRGSRINTNLTKLTERRGMWDACLLSDSNAQNRPNLPSICACKTEAGRILFRGKRWQSQDRRRNGNTAPQVASNHRATVCFPSTTRGQRPKSKAVKHFCLSPDISICHWMILHAIHLKDTGAVELPHVC